MISRIHRLQSGLVIMTLFSLLFSGCASLNLTQTMKFDPKKPFPWESGDDELQVPARLAVIWKDTVLNQRRKKGVRGFGGRVMFYNDRGTKPIKVDGDITVFAFDNSESETDPSPDRKFIFKRADLPKHYSKSGLGHSYSLWVPWDEVGGEPRKISLLVRYEDQTGAVVMSDPTPQTLPGIPKGIMSGKKNKQQSKSSIQQVAFEEPVDFIDPQSSNSRMTTDTINIPQSFSKKYLRNSVEESSNKPNELNNAEPVELPPFEGEIPQLEKQRIEEKRTTERQTNYYDPQAFDSQVNQPVTTESRLAKSQFNESMNSKLEGQSDFRARSRSANSRQRMNREMLKNQFSQHSSSLQARYEQHKLQAQTAKFEMPTRVASRYQRNLVRSPSLPQTKSGSNQTSTEWEWITPESSANSPAVQ